MNEKHYGQEHLEVATTLTNLGNTYRELKDYEKAKELFERALKTLERHYGQDHFGVAITLTNLGNVYGDLGDFDWAKEIIERAVNIDVKHFGEDDVEVAMTLRNLAMTHGKLGEYQQAAEMLERVLPVFETHFGAHHDQCKDVRLKLYLATRLKKRACTVGHQIANVVGCHAQMVASLQQLQCDG